MDAAYTSSCIQTLTDYAETARATASMVQHSTMQQLGKRMRQNDSAVDDDENDSDNTEKKSGNMDDDTAILGNDGNSNNIPLFHDDQKLGNNTEKKPGIMDDDTATLDNDGNSNNIPLLHDDQKLDTLKTRIFNIGYKKVKMWDVPSVNLISLFTLSVAGQTVDRE